MRPPPPPSTRSVRHSRLTGCGATRTRFLQNCSGWQLAFPSDWEKFGRHLPTPPSVINTTCRSTLLQHPPRPLPPRTPTPSGPTLTLRERVILAVVGPMRISEDRMACGSRYRYTVATIAIHGRSMFRMRAFSNCGKNLTYGKRCSPRGFLILPGWWTQPAWFLGSQLMPAGTGASLPLAMPHRR